MRGIMLKNIFTFLRRNLKFAWVVKLAKKLENNSVSESPPRNLNFGFNIFLDLILHFKKLCCYLQRGITQELTWTDAPVFSF